MYDEQFENELNEWSKIDYEYELKNILTIIRESGVISQPELTRRIQHLHSFMRRDILDSLIESEQIIEEWSNGEANRILYLRAVK